MTGRLPLVVLTVTLVAGVTGSTFGQTFWSAGTGDWYTPGNWTLGVPTDPADAVIANGGTAQILAPGASVHRLRVGRTEGPGSLLVDGGALTVTDDLHLNEGSTGPASVIVRGGGTVTVPDTVVGFNNAADASFLISGEGTIYNSRASFTVGRAGTGYASLIVDGGAVLASGTSSIGALAGSSGIAEVKGAGSRWTNTGDFTIGNSAFGELRVSGGGQATNSVGNIGAGVGSNGFVTVDGVGSSWRNNSVLAVGIAGSGGMNISNGGNVTNTHGRIGRETGGLGNVHVSGAGSRWTNNGDLTVGNPVGGDGALIIDEQATVYVQNSLTIDSLSSVTLNGGTLRFNLAGGLDRLTYNGGTIQLGRDVIIGNDYAIDALFGFFGLGSPTVHAHQGLTIEGSASVEEHFVVEGGKFTAKSMVVKDSVLAVRHGGSMTTTGLTLFGNNSLIYNQIIISGAGSSWTGDGLSMGTGVTRGTLVIENQALVNLRFLDTHANSIVNLHGGTLRLGSYDNQFGSAINYTAGTLELMSNDREIGSDKAIKDFFGPAPTITAGKGLMIEKAATLQTAVTIDGGTLSVGSLVNGHLLAFQRGTLNITNQAVTIASAGPLGDALDINDDMIVNVTLGITNQGLVTGDGEIGGVFANAVGGELRADPGKSLTLTGSGNANDGQIKLLGGSLDFRGDLTNNAGAFISGNGSLLSRGLTNRGMMNFAGTANIVGHVINTTEGKIISGGGGATIFFDDVVNNGEIRTSTNGFTVFFGNVTGSGAFTGAGTVNFEGDLAPGNSPGVVHFAGDVVFGSDATLEIELGGADPSQYDQISVSGNLGLGGSIRLSLIDNFVPMAGQTFNILNFGSLSGAFSSIHLPLLNGLDWNMSELSSGLLTVVASTGADFDGDGDVDGDDLTRWAGGFGTSDDGTHQEGDADGDLDIDGADFLSWQRELGGTNSPLSTTAIPEPGSLLLALGGCLALATRHRFGPSYRR